MKHLCTFLLLITLLAFKSSEPQKIVFFGDSITQAGIQPDGYITKIQNFIDKNHPGKYKTIGSGIGGNKVYDLYLRKEEMLAHKPEIIVIYIGVNDVWHKASSGTGTDADKFEKFYTKMVDEFKSKNIRVILATPAVIGERHDHSNSQDGDLNYYSNIIRSIAKTKNLELVDLRKIFLDYSKSNNPQNADRGILTTDRVHLNEKGNQLVADEFSKVLFK